MLQDHLQAILNTICTHTRHLNTNASHFIYELGDKQEASMAFDVFNVLGFEVKLYDENETSRLYISKPAFSKETLENKLRTANAYANALKRIEQSMQTLCSVTHDVSDGFSINLLNNADNSQKITLTIHKKQVVKAADPELQTQTTSSAPAQPARKAVATRASRPKKMGIITDSSPAIAKAHLVENGKKKGREKGAFMRWIYNTFIRHIVAYSVEILIIIVFLFGLSAIMVTSKAFICPDFAADERNTPWYCDRQQIRQLLTGEDEPPPEINFPDSH